MCRNHASHTSVNFGTSHKSCCVSWKNLPHPKILTSYLNWNILLNGGAKITTSKLICKAQCYCDTQSINHIPAESRHNCMGGLK